MKIYCLGLLLMGLHLQLNAQTVNSEMLENKNDTFFLRTTLLPFTGTAVTTIANGKTIISSDYVKGVLNGLEINYNSSGGKYSEIHFQNGKFNGLYTQWYDNGQMEFQKIYKDDFMYGLSTHWYSNGKLQSKGDYENCREEGPWIFWYDNGNKEKGSYQE